MTNLATNTSIKTQTINTVEGKATHGDIQLKVMMAGDAMTVLEIRYMPGAGTPLHVHQHESMVYVMSGRVAMIVGKDTTSSAPATPAATRRASPTASKASKSRWSSKSHPPLSPSPPSSAPTSPPHLMPPRSERGLRR